MSIDIIGEISLCLMDLLFVKGFKFLYLLKHIPCAYTV